MLLFTLEQGVSGKIIPARYMTVLENLQKIHGHNLVIASILERVVGDVRVQPRRINGFEVKQESDAHSVTIP